MPKTNGGNINFNVNMTVNRSGLNEILKPLQQIQSELNSMSTDKLSKEFQQAASSAKQLESIINSSWNDKLGQLNLDKFNQSVKSSYGSVSQLKNSLTGAGSAGESAFNTLASQVLNTNLQLKESNKLLDDMATSMANTIKWGITSSIFNNITSSIQQAYYYAKDLDTSLNSIRIVTGDSADQMQRFAKTANNAAKDLGRSTLDYTNAALSFYQQGLSDEQVAARTETTLKAQNITGVGTEMVDYLTAVWNGFKVQAEETQGVVDKLAKVADSSASDMSQLAIAMSKVAATANVMGVDVDQLTAQLATVIATTRQAPESVGTAFKTIYSRLNDIKTGADDAEISLGNYSGKMAELGFNVLDANGRLRDTGQVMEQIGSRWNSLSKEQQIYLAQTMGGMRQVTQITALFENWTTYSELLNDSLSAQGSLNEKNNIYLESTTSYMEKLGAETERTYDILFDQDAVNGFSGVFTQALKVFNDYIQGIGGGANVFINLGTTIANVFNKQIGSAINAQIQNIETLKNNLAQIKAQQEWSQAVLDNVRVGHASNNDTVSQAALEKQAAIAQRTLQVRKALTQEQYNYLQGLQRQIGIQQTKIDYLSQYKNIGDQIFSDINASTAEFEEQLKVQQGLLKAQQERLQTIAQATNNSRNYADTEERRKAVIQSIQHLSNNTLLSQEQRKAVQDAIIKLENGSKLNNEEIRKIIEAQNVLLKNQQGIVNRVKQGYEGRKAAEDGTLQQLKDQQAARERIVKQEQDSNARQIDIQNAVKVTTGMVQSLSSLIGGISTALDESATASEKLNGVWAAGTGTISGIANIFMPGSGILIQGLSGLIKSSFELFGIWGDLENLFKSNQEKINEFNQTIQQTGQNNQQTTSQIASLEQIRQEYETLSEKAGQYGSHIDRLTEEEKTRYHELTNKFTEYNQAVIVGYDEQGNAIVRGQQALLDTIEILKQAKKQANAASLGSSDTVLQGINAGHVKNTDTPEINQAKEQLNLLNWQYDQLSKEIQAGKQQTVAQLQAELSEYGDAVRLTIEESFDYQGQQNIYNTIIGKNKQTFQEIYNQYINSINDMFDGQTIVIDQEKLSQVLSLGNILKNAVDSYVDNNELGYYSSLLSNYNDQILEQIKNNRDQAQATYDQLVAQAEAHVSYTQADANAILLAMQTFDDIGSEYQQLQEKVESLNIDPNFINRLLSEYITSFTDEISVEQLISKTQTYAESLESVLSNTYDIVVQALTDADFDNFEGTVKQRTAKAVQIINQILNDLDPEQFGTEESRQALANILAQSLDLTNVEISLNEDGKLGVNEDQVAAEAAAQLENARQAITDTVFNKFGFNNGKSKNLFTLDLLGSIFNEDELADFDNVINQINWGAFLKYANQGASAGQALKKAWQDAKQARDKLANNDFKNLSFDTIFDNDSIVKHLETTKKLTDEQQNYLFALEQQDTKLAQIADHEGRRSTNYINRLKQSAAIGQKMYTDQLEAAKKQAETDISNASAILKSTEASNDAKIEAEQIIADKKQEIRNIDYDLARAEQVLTDRAAERAKAEEDAALAKAKQKGQVVQNADSALDNLRSGSDLTSQQAAALLTLEQNNQHLKQLGEKNRYSAEYTAELQKQIEIQSNLTEEARQQTLAILESKKARLEQQRASLSEGLVSEDDYHRARTYMNSSDARDVKDAQTVANAKIVEQYQEQAQVREKVKQLDEEILNIEGEILQVNTNNTDNPERDRIQALEDQLDALGRTREELKDFVEVLQQNSEDLAENQQQAQDMAIALWKMQQAMADLTKNFDDYEKAILAVKDLTEQQKMADFEYLNAIQALRSAMEGLLGVQLSSEFLSNADNLQLMRQAINGNIQALNQLRAAAVDDILINLDLQPNATSYIKSLIDDFIANTEFDDLQIGAALDDSNFIAALNAMIHNGQITAEQVSAILAGIGYEAQVGSAGHQTTISYPQIVQRWATTYGGPDAGEYIQRTTIEMVPQTVTMAVPYIKGANYKGNRTPASYVSAHPSSSGGGGRSGGGGGKRGGSGGKTKTPSTKTSKEQKQEKQKDPQHLDQLEEEADRYHDINLQIKRLADLLDSVAKRQKKLTGKDLINNLKQQIALLEKQIAAYQTKAELARQEADEIRNSLQSQGVLFDANTGMISNYSQILQRKLAEVNGIIQHYNSLSATQQQAYKQTVEKAKKQYEELKQQLARYDQLISELLPDLDKQIQDARDQIIEKQIQQFKMKIEIELDLSEATKSWNKFKRKVIDQIHKDDILGNTKATLEDFFAYYDKNNSSKGLIPSLTDQIYSTMDQINQINSGGTSTVYGDNKAQALQDLNKYTQDLMTSLQDVEDLIDEVKQAFFDMINETSEAFQSQVKSYELLNSILNHDKKLIELVFGEKSYKQLDTFYKKQAENNNKELDFQKQQKDFWWAKMQQSKTRLEGLEQGSNAWIEQSKRFEELKKQWISSVEDFNSKVQESIQNLLDMYQNNVAIIFDDLGKKLTGGKGLEYVGQEWELVNKQADMYLDKINSMAQIQNFQAAAQKAIDENQGNIKAQNSLKNIMQGQLKYLKDKDKLTQYDVDRANMLLQIEIKRLALQNARQSKSKLRLRRDSQGNYTYQYTADQQQVEDSDQALRDAQTDLYNLDKNQLKNNLDTVYSLNAQMMEKLRALYEEYPTWTQQAEDKRKLIIQYYTGMINDLNADNQQIRLNLTQSTIDSLASLYGVDKSNFTEMTQAEQDALMTNLIPYWQNGVQTMINTIAGQGGLIPACQDAFQKLADNTKDYQDRLHQLQQAAGIDFSSIAGGIDENIQKTKTLTQENGELIKTYKDAWDAIDALITKVGDLAAAYSTAKTEAIEAAKAAKDFYEQEQRQNAEAASGSSSGSGSESANQPSEHQANVGTGESANGPKPLSESKPLNEKKPNTGTSTRTIGPTEVEGIAASIWMDGDASGWGDDPVRRQRFIEKFGEQKADQIQQYINDHARNSDIYYAWQPKRAQLKNYYYSKFDTGGYTGAWGSAGKLGVLHEKEIVLNKQDTANILSAVNIVRTMNDLLSSISGNTNLPGILSGFSSGNNSSSLLDQNVHITATFPSVNSRVEIENAFSNLINRASQYAFNTQR